MSVYVCGKDKGSKGNDKGIKGYEKYIVSFSGRDEFLRKKPFEPTRMLRHLIDMFWKNKNNETGEPN